MMHFYFSLQSFFSKMCELCCARYSSICSHLSLRSVTEITEVNLSAFAYRLFHEDFSSFVGTFICICLQTVS